MTSLTMGAHQEAHQIVTFQQYQLHTAMSQLANSSDSSGSGSSSSDSDRLSNTSW